MSDVRERHELHRKKEVNTIFPNLLIELKRNKYSQQGLARYIGISDSSMQNKLSGKTQFTLNEMRAIQSVFENCSLDYLFTEYGQKD